MGLEWSPSGTVAYENGFYAAAIVSYGDPRNPYWCAFLANEPIRDMHGHWATYGSEDEARTAADDARLAIAIADLDASVAE